MTRKPGEFTDENFLARRQRARIEVNRLDFNGLRNEPSGDRFFNTVYDRANDDAAQIPWADLAPKPQISNWLKTNPGTGKTALDIACGLGDNAEEISEAGYDTTAFDLSQTAILWAKQRFVQTKVHYQIADLFELPAAWRDGFDLVNECYTLQALPPKMLEKTINAIGDLVKPLGDLLVYTRLRPDDKEPDGPPWPLDQRDALKFDQLGFALIGEERFVNTRGERKIPHQFAHWRKSRQMKFKY
jgi:SAM-dependent methyltransferase